MCSPRQVRLLSCAMRSFSLVALSVVFGIMLAPLAQAGPVDTSQPSGPVTDADRDLLTKVRQAGLWEGPISAQIAMKTQNPKVRAVASQLAVEHHKLDDATLAAAAKLSVGLPDAPTPQQQGWMSQILAMPPEQADKLYVNITRAAHGTVFTIVAADRAATQNDVIRAFAQTGIDYVMRHMGLLESTGLCDSTSLVVPANGPTSATAIAPSTPNTGSVLTGIAMAGLAALVTVYLVKLLGRGNPRSEEPSSPPAIQARASLARHQELT